MLCTGEPRQQPEDAEFPQGSGARMPAKARCMPCASCAHTPASGGTCVGPPEESRAGPGGGNGPVPTTSPGGSQQQGGSKEKSREKQVLGPVAGELGWRQVRELDHVVEELHGPHDVLVLRGGAGGLGHRAALGAALPKPGVTPWLPSGSSDPRDGSSRDYKQRLSSAGVPSPSHPEQSWGCRGVPQGTGRWPSPRAFWWWLYLLAGLQELLDRHHAVFVSVHFLQTSTARRAWQGGPQPSPGPTGAGHSTPTLSPLEHQAGPG